MTAFLVDGRLALDAGALTSGLELAELGRLEACVVTHAHLDHVRDLATVADLRAQLGAAPLKIAGTAGTLAALRAHFFNDVLWPDFSRIPSAEAPTIEYVTLEPERAVELAGKQVRAVLVSHTIEAAGLLVTGDEGTLACSGDTGPTERFWEVLNATPDLRALLHEVSFPNAQAPLALRSGHHTPATLAADLAKYRAPGELPTILYHVKPVFQAEVERECAALRGLDLAMPRVGDCFSIGDGASPCRRYSGGP